MINFGLQSAYRTINILYYTYSNDVVDDEKFCPLKDLHHEISLSHIKVFLGAPLSPFCPVKSLIQTTGPFSAYLNIHVKCALNRLSDFA